MIKAIETIYSNTRFRSRLEARWATFFDALDIPWEYEREGYDLDGVWYLPDFWLPQQKSFFEAKGTDPTQEEFEKARLLCRHSRSCVYIAVGEIKIPTPCDESEALGGLWTKLYSYDPLWHTPSIYPDCPLNAWCECPQCHRVEITPDGRKHFLSCTCLEDLFRSLQIPKSPENRRKFSWLTSFDTPRLTAAYTAARQARFEYR